MTGRDARAALREHGRLFVASGGGSSTPDYVHLRDAEGCHALARGDNTRMVTDPAEVPCNVDICAYCTGDANSADGAGNRPFRALEQADPAEVFGE